MRISCHSDEFYAERVGSGFMLKDHAGGCRQ
jgi:hypothetical protein